MNVEILILHGPNLNLLGERDVSHYGELSLAGIEERLTELAADLKIELRFNQSNHEGVLIDALQEARHWASGVVFNPGGYTHTSIALRDAIESIHVPTVEAHLSNIFAREPFRQTSITSQACIGMIAGFGWKSYALALHALHNYLTSENANQ
jgi:3-dehydroquinate dehydratase-2